MRFARGEGSASPDEIRGIDDAIDPDRQLDEADRHMTRLAKTTEWYLQQGRTEDAERSAASLLQYGSRRFSQLGSVAANQYEAFQRTGDPEYLQGTINILEQAYKLIPDGAYFDIALDPKSGRLTTTHITPDGKEERYDLRPDQLPGLIEQAQNGSIYWNTMFKLGNPKGAEKRETRQYEERREGEKRGYEESKAETKRRQQLEDAEARERRANAEFDRRRREDREYREAHPTSGGASVDEEAFNEAWSAADLAQKAYKDAKNTSEADDPDSDPEVAALKDAYDEAASRFADTIPFNRRSLELQRYGFENFNYVGGDEEAPAAPSSTPGTGGGGQAAPAVPQNTYKGDQPPAWAPGAVRHKTNGGWFVQKPNGKFAPVMAQ